MKKLVTRPHYLFSTENPKFPTEYKVDTASAAEMINKLGNNNAFVVDGHYGSPEKSIFLSEPNDEQVKLARKLSELSGQESILHSDGRSHKLHYVNGPDKGKVVLGEGTVFHPNKPQDNYTVLSDGTIFTHNLDFSKMVEGDAHPHDHSWESEVKKSEDEAIDLHTLKEILSKFGTLTQGRKTSLKFYNIEDPKWKETHDLAHQETQKHVDARFGNFDGVKKLGSSSLREIRRMLEWEWLATHKQREKLAEQGIKISDEEFNKELNTVMADSVHRAISGKNHPPHSVGFYPHKNKIPLNQSIKEVEGHANKLGLRDSDDTFDRQRVAGLIKSEKLIKAPYEFTSSDPGDTIDPFHEGIYSKNPVRYTLIHSEPLPNGLYHKVYKDNNEKYSHEYRHHITTNKDENRPIAVMATSTEGLKSGAKIRWANRDRKVKGMGLGEQLYLSVAKFHNGRLKSDSTVSLGAHTIWERLSRHKDKGIHVDLAPYARYREDTGGFDREHSSEEYNKSHQMRIHPKANLSSFFPKDVGRKIKEIFNNSYKPKKLAASEKLAKTPLIYEAPDEKSSKEVIRWEREGTGPYSTYFGEQAEMGIENHGDFQYEDRTPAPKRDPGFTPEDHEAMRPYMKFGFENKKQSNKWFTPEEQAKMKEKGFAPKKVKARRIWSSGKQVFFEPFVEKEQENDPIRAALGLGPKMKKADKNICMPKKDVIKEHKRLVNTLKNPTKEKLKEEAKEQSGELKEYLKKGQQGDWNKEGYNIHPFIDHKKATNFVSSHPTDLIDVFPENVVGNHSAYATKDGKIIGHIQLSERDGQLIPISTKVHEDHQRKGIASAMVSSMEKLSGKKIARSDNESLDGKAFYSKLGKNSLYKAIGAKLKIGIAQEAKKTGSPTAQKKIAMRNLESNPDYYGQKPGVKKPSYLMNNPKLKPLGKAEPGDETYQKHLDMVRSKDPEIRMSVASNPNLHPDHQKTLTEDIFSNVRKALAGNPNLHPDHQKTLTEDISTIRYALASNPNLHPDHQKTLTDDSDPNIRNAISRNPNLHPDHQKILANDRDNKVRHILASNPNLHPDHQKTLAEDIFSSIRYAIASNPNLHLDHQKTLTKDSDPNIRSALAKNPNLHPDHQKTLAEDKDYDVRKALADNPNLHLDHQKTLANDDNIFIRSVLANNSRIHPEVQNKLIEDNIENITKGLAQNPSLSLENQKKLANHKNVEVLEKLAINPWLHPDSHKALFERDLRSIDTILMDHPGVHPDIKTAIENRENDKRMKDSVSFSMNTGKLRELRDHIEENHAGLAHKNELKQKGFDTQALGVNHLLDSKGKLSTKAVQDHIDSQPKLTYATGSTLYGDTDEHNFVENESEAEQEAYDKHQEAFDPADYDVHRENFLDRDKVLEHAHEEENKEPNPYGVVRKNFENDEDYEEALDEAKQQFEEDFDHIDHGRDYGLEDDDDYLDTREYERAVEHANERHNENIELPDFKAQNDQAYENALSDQQHTPEQSKVFQLKITPGHEKQMQQAGVHETFQNMLDASKRSGHPTDDKTLGWVRYTQGKDGTHIDEIQSDFGQSFIKQARKQADEALRNGQINAAQHARAIENANSQWPDEHLSKIHDIVFGGKDPNHIIHEAFLQHLRNKGENIGKDVHIWNSIPKGEISLGQEPSSVMYSSRIAQILMDPEKHEYLKNISNNKDNPQYREALAFKKLKEKYKFNNIEEFAKVIVDRANKANPSLNLTDDEVKEYLKAGNNPSGRVYNVMNYSKFKVDHPEMVPGHMRRTYEQQPPKIGYKPAKYGQISTQHNPNLEDKDTWAMRLRKREKKYGLLSFSDLKKAREEENMLPGQKKKFRSERAKFSKDPLEQQLTSVPGVSDRGIEVRRGDSRVKGAVSYGYSRVTSPQKHMEQAKKRFKKAENNFEELIHYSSTPGIKEIDPSYKGTGVDSRVKGRDTWHPHSFYYRANTLPEAVVVQNARSRYTVRIPKTTKIYDLGKDPLNLKDQVIQENNGALNMDSVHEKIKNSGFHGFFNSQGELPHALALYHKVPVFSEENIKKNTLGGLALFKRDLELWRKIKKSL